MGTYTRGTEQIFLESAFPIKRGHLEPGLSLRDYFAGQAIEGLVYGLTEADAKVAAESAYLIADALIEARKKR